MMLRQISPLVLLVPLCFVPAACADEDGSSDASEGGSGRNNTTGGRTSSGGNGPAGGNNALGGNEAAGGSNAGGNDALGGNSAAGADSAAAGAEAEMEGRGPAPVLLRSAANYAVLAKSAISNVPSSAVTGNVGLSPAAATYVTGFGLTKAGTHWTSPQVIGRVFAADNTPPTPTNLTTAVADMQTAYTDAATRPTPDFRDLGAGAIGGLVLEPGLYKWTTGVTIASDVTLEGAANDVWIFQVAGDLKLSAAKAMTLGGGARAKNIVWQVAGFVDLGTTSHAEGILLAKTAIHLKTGASINGRLFAQTAVDLAGSTVTEPAP